MCINVIVNLTIGVNVSDNLTTYVWLQLKYADLCR